MTRLDDFKNLLLGGGVLLAIAALPAVASAQNAYATADVNMRAGPGTRYPVVTTIPQDRPVTLYGCIQGYDWCDVEWRGNRGWVFGDYVEYAYQGRRVIIGEYGPRIDLPIISFSFGSYWDRHYRNRPWYDDRDRWWDRRDGRRRDDDRRDWDNGYWDRDDGREGSYTRNSRDQDDQDEDQARSRNQYEDRDRREQTEWRVEADEQQRRAQSDDTERRGRGPERSDAGPPYGRGPDCQPGEDCPPFGRGPRQ